MNQWMESFMVYNCFTGVCRVGEYIVFYGEHWNRASSCLHSCSWSCGLGRDHGVPFAKAYFTGEGPGFFHKTLFIPILLHGLYDCFLFTAVEMSNSVPEGHEISDKDSGVILFCFFDVPLYIGFKPSNGVRISSGNACETGCEGL